MEFEEHFIDSLGYEIELTSRVFHEIGKRWFDENAKGILTSEEFCILDTLDCNKNLSQIELANAILKGKAHTGKYLDSLEAKGYISRLYDTKNSRMVKIPVMTSLGKKTYDEMRTQLEDLFKTLHQAYPRDKVEKLRESLKEIRIKLAKIGNISFN